MSVSVSLVQHGKLMSQLNEEYHSKYYTYDLTNFSLYDEENKKDEEFFEKFRTELIHQTNLIDSPLCSPLMCKLHEQYMFNWRGCSIDDNGRMEYSHIIFHNVVTSPNERGIRKMWRCRCRSMPAYDEISYLPDNY